MKPIEKKIQIQFGSVRLDEKLVSTIRNECRNRFDGVLGHYVTESINDVIKNHEALINEKVEACFKRARLDDYIKRAADKLIIDRTAEVLANIGKLNESTNVPS